ncbi:MAG: hypothetical protein ABW352_16980 [Polyangiales bacterium]
MGSLIVLFAASCAQSSAIDDWDAPGQGLGGAADDSEVAEARADATVRDAGRDARMAGRVDAEVPEPDEPEEPDEPDEPEDTPVVDASARDARIEDSGDTVPSRPVDAGQPPSEPQDAGSGAPVDAGVSQCAACPPPGSSCMTPLGTCGCRLFPIGPCGPRPPFAP